MVLPQVALGPVANRLTNVTCIEPYRGLPGLKLPRGATGIVARVIPRLVPLLAGFLIGARQDRTIVHQRRPFGPATGDGDNHREKTRRIGARGPAIECVTAAGPPSTAANAGSQPTSAVADQSASNPRERASTSALATRSASSGSCSTRIEKPLLVGSSTVFASAMTRKSARSCPW